MKTMDYKSSPLPFLGMRDFPHRLHLHATLISFSFPFFELLFPALRCIILFISVLQKHDALSVARWGISRDSGNF